MTNNIENVLSPADASAILLFNEELARNPDSGDYNNLIDEVIVISTRIGLAGDELVNAATLIRQKIVPQQSL